MSLETGRLDAIVDDFSAARPRSNSVFLDDDDECKADMVVMSVERKIEMELWKKEPFQLLLLLVFLFFLVTPLQKAGHKILEKLHDDDDVVVFHTF